MEEYTKMYILSAPAAAAGLPPTEVLQLRRNGPEFCMVYASWSVLEPEQDAYSEPAYDALRQRLIRLRSLGVEPVLCLYHGEMPEWFRVRGGWEKEDNLRHYLRYVGKTVRSAGHLASRYVTVAEPDLLCRKGDSPVTSRFHSLRALSHMIGGHVRAYRLIHDTRSQRALTDTAVGFTVRMHPVSGLHRRFLGETELTQAALLRAMALGRFVPPLLNPLHVKPGEWCDFAVITTETNDAAEVLRQEAEIITGKPAYLAGR